MKFKKSILIFSIFFILFLSICAISANENTTDILNIEENDNIIEIDENQDASLESQDKIVVLDDSMIVDENKEKVKISTYDKEFEYKSHNKMIVGVTDKNGNSLTGIKVKINAYTGNKYKSFYANTDNSGLAKFDFTKLSPGKHKLKIIVETDKYSAEKTSTVKIDKITYYSSAISNYIQGTNKKLKLKVSYTNSKGKEVVAKNIKLKVKVKIAKKTKTYNVKTNSKGEATLFNVKSLKAKNYKLTVTSNDKTREVNDKIYLSIFKPAKKVTTVKMNHQKKLKNGDMLYIFFTTRDDTNSKGVHANSYKYNNPLDGIPHTWVVKAKFFFKNKKTGKIITKITKTKNHYKPFYYIEEPSHKLIKGYTPIKAKVWYVTN